MFKLFEHAGWERAHDPHMWWVYDARITSPKTCMVCLSLDGTHYRGDAIYTAFPYHYHRTVNVIKPQVHPHCRCRLIWAGRSVDVLATPVGLRKKPRKPEIPKFVGRRHRPIDLSPSQRRQFKTITKHAREIYRLKQFEVK